METQEGILAQLEYFWIFQEKMNTVVATVKIKIGGIILRVGELE